MSVGDNVKLGAGGLTFWDKEGRPLSQKQAWAKITNRILNWYLDVQLYLLHLASDVIPFSSIRHLLFKASGMKIGQGSTVHMGVRFFHPAGVSIGRDTIVGFRSFLDGRSALTIGDHVDIASEVLIYNSEHDIHSEDFSAQNKPVAIADYCFIGPRAILLPGVSLGRGAVVAAGAVVTHDVPELTVVAGVPAKPIGARRITHPHYHLGRARLFQ